MPCHSNCVRALLACDVHDAEGLVNVVPLQAGADGQDDLAAALVPAAMRKSTVSSGRTSFSHALPCPFCSSSLLDVELQHPLLAAYLLELGHVNLSNLLDVDGTSLHEIDTTAGINVKIIASESRRSGQLTSLSIL